jgi:hypothetical protein
MDRRKWRLSKDVMETNRVGETIGERVRKQNMGKSNVLEAVRVIKVSGFHLKKPERPIE